MKIQKQIEEAVERLKKRSRCDICNGTGVNVFSEKKEFCGHCDGGLSPLSFYEAKQFLTQELSTIATKSAEGKYKLHDSVWIMEDNKPKSFVIYKIVKKEWLEPSGDSDYHLNRYSEHRYFDYNGNGFDEDKLFATKEYLLEALSKPKE